MMRARGAWSRAAAIAFVATACSKSEGPREALSTSPRILPGLGVPQPSPAVDPAATATTASPPHDPIDFDGAPLSYTVTEKLEAASVPVVDPDQAILQAARVSAGGCFVGLQGGPDVQSAIVEVTVVPSGQVSRTKVSAQTTEREVIDCLTRVGDGLQFTSKEDSKSEGIRSFSIDVTVARYH